MFSIIPIFQHIYFIVLPTFAMEPLLLHLDLSFRTWLNKIIVIKHIIRIFSCAGLQDLLLGQC